MIILDVWRGPYSQEHVARYIVTPSEAMKLAAYELEQGFLVNLRREHAWGPYTSFDNRLGPGAPALKWVPALALSTRLQAPDRRAGAGTYYGLPLPVPPPPTTERTGEAEPPHRLQGPATGPVQHRPGQRRKCAASTRLKSGPTSFTRWPQPIG